MEFFRSHRSKIESMLAKAMPTVIVEVKRGERVGFTIGESNGLIFVSSVEPQGPASRAGVVEAAVVHSLNGKVLNHSDPVQLFDAMARAPRPLTVGFCQQSLATPPRYRDVRVVFHDEKLGFSLQERCANLVTSDIVRGGQAQSLGIGPGALLARLGKVGRPAPVQPGSGLAFISQLIRAAGRPLEAWFSVAEGVPMPVSHSIVFEEGTLGFTVTEVKSAIFAGSIVGLRVASILAGSPADDPEKVQPGSRVVEINGLPLELSASLEVLRKKLKARPVAVTFLTPCPATEQSFEGPFSPRGGTPRAGTPRGGTPTTPGTPRTPEGAAEVADTETVSAGFDDGPLGFTLTEWHDGTCRVTELEPNSQAGQQGVLLGSRIVLLNRKVANHPLKLDGFAAWMGATRRPLTITFAGGYGGEAVEDGLVREEVDSDSDNDAGVGEYKAAGADRGRGGTIAGRPPSQPPPPRAPSGRESRRISTVW